MNADDGGLVGVVCPKIDTNFTWSETSLSGFAFALPFVCCCFWGGGGNLEASLAGGSIL